MPIIPEFSPVRDAGVFARAEAAQLRAQHRLFETLPGDLSPPLLARLAHIRARALARRRLQGRPSSWPDLRAGWPRIALAIGGAALLLLASRQVVL
jgi:hypothetical protein